jgi:hypothetical protein
VAVQSGTNSETIKGNASLTVQAGSRTVDVTGGDYSATSNTAAVKLHGVGAGVSIHGEAAGVKITGEPSFDAHGTATAKISSPDVDIGDDNIKIHGSTITLSTDGGSIVIDASGITISGTKITSSADSDHTITGAMVKIN